uniref:GDSL esterase/lipase n=1 Tax=Oryza brachyantha TaxID=4533 RepID=J3LQG5_ORYBR
MTITAVVSVVVLAAASCSPAAAAVPAVYVLGDSLADVGNNNHLLTLLKADFPHNGIDYPGGKATGRFSNGKNFPDFLAENLGLATSPPYLAISSSSNANYVNGVNFASGGAGVLNSTNKILRSYGPAVSFCGGWGDAGGLGMWRRGGADGGLRYGGAGGGGGGIRRSGRRQPRAASEGTALGTNFGDRGGPGGDKLRRRWREDQCISFDKQIEYYSKVYASLVQSLGEAQAANHLAKSLFAITVGSNDIIGYARSCTIWERGSCCSWGRGRWGAARRCVS